MVYDNPGGRFVWLEDILSLDGASLSATPERTAETAKNNSQAAEVAMNALALASASRVRDAARSETRSSQMMALPHAVITTPVSMP